MATNNRLSPIEYLVINHYCSLNEFASLISYVLQFRRLTVQKIKINNSNLIILSSLSIQLNNLKSISNLNILTIIVSDDITFLDAYRLKKLILNSSSQLEKFHFIYYEHLDNERQYPTFIGRQNQFSSSFWIQQKWIFGGEIRDTDIEYIIRSYRDKTTELTVKKFFIVYSIKETIQITKVYFEEINNIKELDFLFILCPYMEYFKVERINIIDIQSFLRIIPKKINRINNHHLRSLCFELSTANGQIGKTYLITGSAGGIGNQTALELAKRGAKVVLLARPSNLQQAINDVKKVAREDKLISGYPLDLADLLSIEKCIEEYKKNEGENTSITALINNAGVMACPYSRTKDGFEMQMGTNHFGHFYLTQLLLPQLLKSKSRVVNVSSISHALLQVPCTLETYTEQLNKQTYKPWHAYSLSKIANIYFTIELQRRFGAQGLRAYSLHPGGVNTGLQRHTVISQWFIAPLRFLLFKTQLEGAQTSLFCAVSDKAVPGKYHSDCRETKVDNPHAENPERAREWWDYSEKIVAEKIKQRH
ncbi:unnamed protein product [Rotaria sordida]|uniref:Uncharacterized protein n=2 Tax=Rotaria sordida TaxID=392033 RepID=A0A815F235_9BILA|nr:unnamed protein product [Rotaria sordida]CAF1585021.1 unnamed protein product [Rotaria sordida]